MSISIASASSSTGLAASASIGRRTNPPNESIHACPRSIPIPSSAAAHAPAHPAHPGTPASRQRGGGHRVPWRDETPQSKIPPSQGIPASLDSSASMRRRRCSAGSAGRAGGGLVGARAPGWRSRPGLWGRGGEEGEERWEKERMGEGEERRRRTERKENRGRRTEEERKKTTPSPSPPLSSPPTSPPTSPPRPAPPRPARRPGSRRLSTPVCSACVCSAASEASRPSPSPCPGIHASLLSCLASLSPSLCSPRASGKPRLIPRTSLSPRRSPSPPSVGVQLDPPVLATAASPPMASPPQPVIRVNSEPPAQPGADAEATSVAETASVAVAAAPVPPPSASVSPPRSAPLLSLSPPNGHPQTPTPLDADEVDELNDDSPLPAASVPPHARTPATGNGPTAASAPPPPGPTPSPGLAPSPKPGSAQGSKSRKSSCDLCHHRKIKVREQPSPLTSVRPGPPVVLVVLAQGPPLPLFRRDRGEQPEACSLRVRRGWRRQDRNPASGGQSLQLAQ